MKTYKEEWNFLDANMKKYTHGFHSYPAMMVPDIIDNVISEYCNLDNNSIVFDPYMGSGTTLVQCGLYDIKKVIGTDINPLARLISNAKISSYDIEQINFHIKMLKKHISETKEVSLKNFSIIDSWYKEKNVFELSVLDSYIEKIEGNEKVFFQTAFTEVVRRVSFTRNNEFKLYRIAEDKRVDFSPNTYDEYFEIIRKNIDLYLDYEKVRNKDVQFEIYDFNTVYNIPKNILKPDSVDLVITSPPYGDSGTTVAYGQFSRLANEWLGYSEAQKVDKLLMGGKRQNIESIFNVKILDDILNELRQIDKKNKKNRVKDVEAFYSDYRESIHHIADIVKKDGIVVYVVGNRRVSDIEMPTDDITRIFFEENGFRHLETIVREIQNKRMPSKTAPNNKKGTKVKTMTKEYIVILQKIR